MQNKVEGISKVASLRTKERWFDFSLLLYFCAFLIFNNDYLGDVSGYDSLIRNGATFLVLMFGSILVINRSESLYPKLSYFKSYGTFVMYCMLSLIWAEDWTQSMTFIPGMFRILIISFFLSARIVDKSGFETIFKLFVFSVLLKLCIVGQMMYNSYGSDMIYERFGLIFGYNPNDIAVSCVCASSFLIYQIIEKQNKLRLIFIIVCLIIFVVTILLTQSRKGLLGLFLFPLLFFYFNRVSVKKHALLLFVLTVLFLLLISSSYFYDISGGALDRLNGLFAEGSMKDGSTKMREDLISKAISIWYENPLCGIGLNNFALHSGVSKGYYSHNNYTEILSGLGLIGFFLYYIPIISVLLKMFNRKINTPLAILLKCLVVVLLFLDVGNISYCSFYIQVIFTLLFLCYFYNKKLGSFLINKQRLINF